MDARQLWQQIYRLPPQESVENPPCCCKGLKSMILLMSQGNSLDLWHDLISFHKVKQPAMWQVLSLCSCGWHSWGSQTGKPSGWSSRVA